MLFSAFNICDITVQRMLAVLLAGFLCFYFFIISLVYNGIRLPFLRFVPFVKKHYILYFRKCKNPKTIVFNMETRFDLWWAYPLVPYTTHKWWHKIKLRYWTRLFFIKRAFYYLLCTTFFIIFSINLEGLIGPIMYFSWSDIFRG